MSAHTIEDLRQMQALPLEAKILMTKQRIKAWYEAWKRFEIFDEKTGKTRFITFDTREQKEPPLKETEYVVYAVPGWVYVSFSGGKDSTVLKHIVDSMYSDIPSLFVNTGLEYPEIQKFAKSQKNVVTVRPTMRFDEVIKEYGYPVASKEVSRKIYYAKRGAKWAKKYAEGTATRADGEKSRFCIPKRFLPLLEAPFDVSSYCCDVMKKKPLKQYAKQTERKPMVGTMASESSLRKNAWIKHGCNAFESASPISQPLSFWTEQDVLHYIKKYNVPYCSVCGDIVIDLNDENPDQMNIIDLLGDYKPGDKLKTTGCDRTGCIFCGFGCHLEKGENRFQKLKITHPRQYEYCIGGGAMVDGKWQPNKEGLGLGKVLDYIGVKYD